MANTKSKLIMVFAMCIWEMACLLDALLFMEYLSKVIYGRPSIGLHCI